jgi:hypothetical protein
MGNRRHKTVRRGTWFVALGLVAGSMGPMTAETPADGLGAPPAALPAPLPGAAWTDPDSVNWIDVSTAETARPQAPARLMERLTDRLAETRGEAVPAGSGRRLSGLPMGERLLGRRRGEPRLARSFAATVETTPDAQAAINTGWPTPDRLLDQLERLAAATAAQPAIVAWATATLEAVDAVLDTEGPADPAAAGPLLSLGETVTAGMYAADAVPASAVASETRRAALAVARRAAVWRAATACGSAGPFPSGDVAVMLGGRGVGDEASRLLLFLERYEASCALADAAAVKGTLDAIASSSCPLAGELARTTADHYLAPNVRIAIHRGFVERMLPESTVTNGPVHDFVLGRPVHGRRTVEQSTGIRFVPSVGEIRLELVVNGEVASRTVTESGPVALHSRSRASFTVLKPISLTPAGLDLGVSRGTASTRAQLANIQTSFDSVPIMGSLVRTIARNQHDDAQGEASREVSGKIVGQACREVDQQAGPKLEAMAEQIRERLWNPLVSLGLEPTPVALETTADVASMRLRLAASTQLAAHTPRPRAPGNALVSMQLHETVVNNACDRFGIAGRRLELPQLVQLVCERAGIPPRLPDDLPDGVAITFAATEPLRVECRDGLLHLRLSLDTLESGRRTWYDLVVRVAYRPVIVGPQVFLEREGPVQIGGPGHEGRMEIALRTIFGKIFVRERPVPVVPQAVIQNPRLADVRPVQAVAADGWLGIALAEPTGVRPAPPTPTASRFEPGVSRVRR